MIDDTGWLVALMVLIVVLYIASGLSMKDIDKKIVRKQLIENNLGEWTMDKVTGKTSFKSVIKFAE